MKPDLIALADAATPRPWHVDNGFIRDAKGGILCVIPNNPENGKNWKNDAALIVAAVNSFAPSPTDPAAEQRAHLHDAERIPDAAHPPSAGECKP